MNVSIKSRADDAGVPSGLDDLDLESRAWLEGLQESGPRREASLARLHALLLRGARHEANRRRHWLGFVSGPELDDIAQQAADDALMTIIGKLSEFRGASRFTTWAYKFAMFEVSVKMARHAWHARPVALDDADWKRLPDELTALPESTVERYELLSTLRRVVETELTEHQRHVFVAAALNEIPVDVIALEIGSNRNAVYKTLFDARRKLRARLTEFGHTWERT
jgi:RNA polymerase sigma-70 factor (ECF subfamily)